MDELRKAEVATNRVTANNWRKGRCKHQVGPSVSQRARSPRTKHQAWVGTRHVAALIWVEGRRRSATWTSMYGTYR